MGYPNLLFFQQAAVQWISLKLNQVVRVVPVSTATIGIVALFLHLISLSKMLKLKRMKMMEQQHILTFQCQGGITKQFVIAPHHLVLEYEPVMKTDVGNLLLRSTQTLCLVNFGILKMQILLQGVFALISNT